MSGKTLVPALVDLDALAGAVAPLVAEFLRPVYVTQRSVLAVCGMPPRSYMWHCRRGHWPTFKDKRLRYSKTEDVVRFVEAHPEPVRTQIVAKAGETEEARLFARVGIRRIS